MNSLSSQGADDVQVAAGVGPQAEQSLLKMGGWYADEAPAPKVRPPLTLDSDVDVCVIGAGLAGLTAAREIARHGWSVAVLEAGRVGGAASGRNTGFVLPGFGEELEAIIERIGEPHAKKLWALSESGLAYVRRTIAETAMPGVEPVPGWAYVSKTDRADELRAMAAKLRAFGTDAEYWPTERVRVALPSNHYFNAVHYNAAFAINPLSYLRGLACAAEDAGVRIFEDTPAVSMDPVGVRKRINTPSARLRASHVVLAGNVDLGGLMPRLAATLVPITTYVMVTEPIGSILRETIPYRGAVSDGDRADNHYRIVGGDRLMWSGRMTTRERDPRRYARGLARDIARVFPQLGAVTPAHLWNGTLGMPIHRMPQIGELYPGVWVASGFGGHGLNTTAMAGELIARGIVEDDQTWRLFAPYELVWAGGAFGRTAMRALALVRRPVERAAHAFARYRERARARRLAKKEQRAARLAQLDAERTTAGRIAAYRADAETVREIAEAPPVEAVAIQPGAAPLAEQAAKMEPEAVVTPPDARAVKAPASEPAQRKRGKKKRKKPAGSANKS